jgi:hypothetical protein
MLRPEKNSNPLKGGTVLFAAVNPPGILLSNTIWDLFCIFAKPTKKSKKRLDIAGPICSNVVSIGG